MRYEDIPLYEPPARYKIRTPETWAKVRDDYAAGVPAAEVCETYDVGLRALRQKAKVEGWRRRDLDDPDPEPVDPDAPPADPALLARQAWSRAARAVERGRVLEAQRWSRLAADFRAAVFEVRALADVKGGLGEPVEPDGPEGEDEQA